MRRTSLDTFELHAFVRLAELASFRATADEIGLSGPALSRMIARIEGRAGARLFDRNTRNVTLTPQGLRFLGLARRVLLETQEALDDFGAYLSARRGRVSMAGLPSVLAALLPPTIARFSRERPEVDIQIIDALSNQVAAAVIEGRADLGCAAAPVEGAERLEITPLLVDEFLAVSAPTDPLLQARRNYSWTELCDMPFVAIAPGTSVRTLIDGALAQQGLNLQPRFDVTHLATAVALVMQGLGVTALPSLSLQMVNALPLTLRPLVGPRVTRRIGIITAKGRTLSPAALSLMEAVLHDARLRGDVESADGSSLG